MAHPDWTSRGKTIAGLIQELQSFEDQNLEVRISVDDGVTSLPISLVARMAGEGKRYAVLSNAEDHASAIRHTD